MQDKINFYLEEISSYTPKDAAELEAFRIAYLSKKGLMAQLFEDFKLLGTEEKRTLGKALNELKQDAESKFESFQNAFVVVAKEEKSTEDLTLPGSFLSIGSRHPLSIVRNKLVELFARLGFSVADGPEIEDDWHIFSALNFPDDHPARDMQDTFFVPVVDGNTDNKPLALRTHTSSVQVRLMEAGKPPFRSIMPGRVYRNEAISARAHCQFHQIEGLYVDENVSFADLKQTLYYFIQEFFGEGTKLRFRPSYFPFTEPSAEMDIDCRICKGAGCNVCKYTGWVEILGCGMVDPSVLENCGIDSKQFSGFAFGMGIERITMLKYQIKDLRLFFENDFRFLKQFVGES